MKKYIYIAAPYSHGDQAKNVRVVLLAADALAAAGYIPFVPHLSHFWHMLAPQEIEFWYDYDLAWLRKCDCLLRLPGESPGADKEVELAIELGMPVYLNIMDCINDAE